MFRPIWIQFNLIICDSEECLLEFDLVSQTKSPIPLLLCSLMHEHTHPLLLIGCNTLIWCSLHHSGSSLQCCVGIVDFLRAHTE